MIELLKNYTFTKILPTVYDDSLTYYELVSKIQYKLNEVINNENVLSEGFVELYEYVKNYFTDLNIQNEINNKLDQMASDGTLANIINQEIFNNKLDTSVFNEFKTENENTLEEMNQTISENKSTLEGQINTLNTNLTNDIDKLKDKNIIVISDSYGDGYTQNEGNIESFLTKLKNDLNAKGFNIVTSSHGGDGFKNGAFLTQLQNLSATIQNKEMFTRIYVVGGYNDINGGDLITTGITQFLTYAKQNYPNARVYTCFVGMTNVAEPQNTQDLLADANYKWNEMTSDKTALTNTSSLLTPLDMETNDYHPNNNGQFKLYQMLKTHILKGGCDNETSIYNVLSPSGVCNTINGNIQCVYHNGMVMIVSNQITSTCDTTTINPGGYTELATLPISKGGNRCHMNCSVWLLGANKGGNGKVFIENGKLIYQHMGETVEGVTGFNLYQISGTFPMLNFI